MYLTIHWSNNTQSWIVRVLTAATWRTRVGCIRIGNECITEVRLKGRIIILLSGARVCNNFFVKYRERASLARFHAAATRFTTREQSACSKFGRGSDRMTHNASTAAAAGAAAGKRNEKGILTTMRGRTIILSFNSGAGTNVFVLVGL